MDYSKYKDGCIVFLQRLIQTPSVNGKNNENAIVKFIEDEAKKLNLPFKIISKDLSRPNIFVGNDFESDKNLLLIAHLDTVPEGNPEKWHYPPFSATIQDDKLYGRGAVDCKGGIAISIYTLKILSDMGKLDAAKFVGVVDEESGADSKLGLMYLLEKGLKAKGAIYTYGEDEKYNSLTIGHRGLIRLWVTCLGESVHSGTREWQDRKKGENAIEGINELLNEMKNLTIPGENKYFPGYRFVLTPTLIEGGKGESIVPDEAKVLFDIRTLPEHNNDEIIKKITEITEKLSTNKRKFKVNVKNNIPAALTDPESEIIKKALRLNKDIFKVESKISGSGPANEGYMLIKRGIPTIMGYGPLGENYHAPNEYADIASIEQSLRFLTEISLLS